MNLQLVTATGLLPLPAPAKPRTLVTVTPPDNPRGRPPVKPTATPAGTGRRPRLSHLHGSIRGRRRTTSRTRRATTPTAALTGKLKPAVGNPCHRHRTTDSATPHHRLPVAGSFSPGEYRFPRNPDSMMNRRLRHPTTLISRGPVSPASRGSRTPHRMIPAPVPAHRRVQPTTPAAASRQASPGISVARIRQLLLRRDRVLHHSGHRARRGGRCPRLLNQDPAILPNLPVQQLPHPRPARSRSVRNSARKKR